MNSRSRLALLSLAPLLTALALANIATNIVPGLENSGSEQQARAGIEREGDIPLPVAHG